MNIVAGVKKLVLKCPYCGGKGELQPGDRAMPGRGEPPLYVCENFPTCDSYVRCHGGTDTPLGTMAGKRLRRLRKTAHDLFDPIWQAAGNELGRSTAYDAAARVMGVKGKFHIGNLDEKGCENFIENMGIIEMEMDRLLDEHSKRGAPPSQLTLEILHALFHPGRDTYLPDIPLVQMIGYEYAWNEAQRCGLVIQEQYKVKLSPKGVDLVYDPTT